MFVVFQIPQSRCRAWGFSRVSLRLSLMAMEDDQDRCHGVPGHSNGVAFLGSMSNI